MKKLVIPTIQSNAPAQDGDRSDRLEFVGEGNTCGGDIYCAGRRVLENWCNALNDKKGYRGIDSGCVMTMIKVQMDALNQLLGITKGSRERQKIRAEDIDSILAVVRKENRICLLNEEPELNRREAFKLITDLLIERLHVTKALNNRFFGMMFDQPEAKSFKELDPAVLKRIKTAMSRSAHLLFGEESET